LTDIDIWHNIFNIDKNEYEVKVMDNKYENNARVFKALCDSNRWMIIEMLQSGEKCACKLLQELDIVQSTLSHHMKILCESGLVDSSRVGKEIHYSLNKQNFEIAKQILNEISMNIE
jgi:ArsR family transcriptional regulator